MKLVSFNVNGIRAIMGKNLSDSIPEMNADVICFQETKAQDHQVIEALEPIKGYYVYCNSAEKKGYSGTAILTKQQPLSVVADIQIAEHDNEGRVLCAEFDSFFLVTVYVPNSGSDLKRLHYRQTWDVAFLTYLKNLEKTKPVVVCGDFNVAHKAIDLANPKSNYNKSAGYMQEEIDGMDNFINSGFIDSFRHINPDKVAYTYWSYRFKSRERNTGWRIDYFLISNSLLSKVKSAQILPEFFGSDHCPILLEIDL